MVAPSVISGMVRFKVMLWMVNGQYSTLYWHAVFIAKTTWPLDNMHPVAQNAMTTLSQESMHAVA